MTEGERRIFTCIDCGKKTTIVGNCRRVLDTPYHRCIPCHIKKYGACKQVHRQTFVKAVCGRCDLEYDVILSAFNRMDFRPRCADCRREDKRRCARVRMRRLFGYKPRPGVD